MPAVVPAISAAFTAVNTFAASSAVAGFLVNTVSSVAMSALATAIRGKPKLRQPGIATDTTTAGGTIPQRLIFGRHATAGQMVCPPMVYQTDGNPNEWLVYVISLADKPVTGLGRIFVDGKALTIDGNPAASQHGDAMGATVLASPQDSLRNKVYIRFHDGQQTAADAYLRRVFGTYPERPWTADMIGTGVAYAVVTFKGKATAGDYQGFPSVKFEVDGHKLLDPRTGTEVFTRNPAVIAWNILRGIQIPGGDVWGVGAADFFLSYVIAAANICDEQVPVDGGGTRPRYQAGLEVSVADEPHEALTETAKAMGGDVADMGGTWLLTAGEPGGPVLSITDDDIIVTDTRSLKPYPGLDETINAIHASYPDPAQQWEAKEAVPLYNAAYEAADGGRRLIAEVDFPAVSAPLQVRALMREMLADHRRMRTHVITLPPDALGAKLGDHIAWSSVINGYNAKLFKVVALRVDPVSLCVALTLTERDPDDYDYNAGSDGRVPTVPSAQPVAPVIAGVTGWNVSAVDAGGRPGIRMAWNPEINAQGLSWVIRLQSDGTVVNSGTTSNLAFGQSTQTAGLKPAITYTVTGDLVLPGRVTESVTTTVTTLDIRFDWEDFSAQVRAKIDAMDAEAKAAAEAANTALATVQDQTAYVDQEVQKARDEIAVGYTSAIGDASREVFEMSSRAGGSVITVPLLDSPWGRWQTQGTVTPGDNEKYPSGQTWDITVTATQQAGILLANPGAAVWTGQMDAAGYVVEVEYTLVSGSLAGAGVALDWNTTNGEFRALVPLSQMVAGSTVTGRTALARAVFRKPDGFTGTFASHDVFVFANFSDLAPMAAKRIKIHRVLIRAATAEEMGGGAVMAAVQVKLATEYLTRTDTEAALGSINSMVVSRFEGNEAKINRSEVTLAGLNGSTAIITQEVVAGQQRAVIRQAAWDGNGNLAPGSAIVFEADQIVAKGSLSADHLVVGLGKNVLIDPDFMDGTAHYYLTPSTPGYALGVRAPGQEWAHPAWPTLSITQGSGAAIYGDVVHSPVVNAAGDRVLGVPAAPGDIDTGSVYVSCHNSEYELILQYYSEDAQLLASFSSARLNYGAGAMRNPDSWQRVSVSGTAPAETAYKSLTHRKHSGPVNSAVFLWKPQLEKAAYVGQKPSQWSPGGQTYASGGRLFAKSITAREADLEKLAAVEGWIKRATIGHAAVDTLRLGDNAVTMHWSANSNYVYFTLAYPAMLTVISNARVSGVSPGYDALGRIRLDSALQRESSFSVSPYTWRVSMQASIGPVAPGVHYVEHEYARISTGALNPPEFSEHHILVLAHYK